LLLFIAVDAIQILTMGNKGKYKIVSNTEENIKNCDSCTRPDIYYIVFDAYASSHQLEKEFGYSNYLIEEELKSKGFRIIPGSRSNYNYTAYSVGSVLNMNYIKNVDTTGRTFDRTYLQALKLVYKNSVVLFLRKENYHTYNHSLFDIDSFPSTIQHIDLWGIREIFDQYKLVFKINFDAGYRFPG